MSQADIIATGSYVGNGGTQSISIGYQLAAMFIINTRTGNPANQKAWSVKTDTMPGSDFLANDTEARYLTTNGVTLVADGFDVGSSNKINRSGETYFYVAFRAGPQVDTGSYTGDGVEGRKITTGRQPALVMTMTATSPGSLATAWKWANVSAKLTAQFQTINHIIEAITVVSDGFELSVGTSPPLGFPILVNVDTAEYHYIAFYELDGSTRQFELGDWDGDGADPQKITTGLQPKFIMVFGQTRTSVQDFGFVSADYPSDRTSIIDGSHRYLNDTEQRMTLLSDGFEASGNWNETGQDYRYLAGYF